MSDYQNNQNINVALVGYGLAGSAFHAPVIEEVEGLTLSTVVSSRKNEISSRYPNVKVLADVDAVLKDDQIDLVVIATPTDTHYALAKAALMADKHVVVDKPFVITKEEAIELKEIAQLKGKKLSVYQNRRFDGDFMTVRTLLDNNALGEIYTFESHFDRFRPHVDLQKWREQDKLGSGVLYDLGAHLIDQAMVLFGKPHWIIADVAKTRKGAKVDDYFHIVLGYNDLRVILHSASIVKASMPRFTVHGDKGSFVKYGLDPQEERLKQGEKPSGALGIEKSTQYGIKTDIDGKEQKVPTIAGDYRIYYNQIANAILTNSPLPVTPEEAVGLIEMIEICIKSSEIGEKLYV